MFIAALFTIVMTWKQHKCPSTDKWKKGVVRECMLSHFSCVQLFAILWTVARQALLFMGFSRKEYWNGLPCPPPGDLSDPGVEPMFVMSLTLAGGFFTNSATWEAQGCGVCHIYIHRHTSTHTHMPWNKTVSKMKKVKNEILPFAATWMDLEIIILNEVRKKKDKYLMISCTCGT